MKNFYYIVLVALMVLIGGNALFATNYVSTATGNWGTTTIWSPAGTPTTADTVTILSGHTITLNTTGNSAATIINSGGTLTTASGQTLNGNLFVYGALNANASATISGNITVTGSSASFKSGSGSTIITGVAGKTFTLANGATLQTSYNATSPATVFSGFITNVTWVIDNSTALTNVIIKSSGSTNIATPPNSQTIGNLQITCATGSANKIFNFGSNFSILGDLVFNDLNTAAGPTTWNLGAYNITTTGTGKAITTSIATASTQLNIKGTGSTLFNGFSSVNFVPATLPSGASCAVTYSGASAQTIAAGTYYTLADSSASTKTLAGNININGTLTMASGCGNINTSSYAVSVTSTGSVNRASGSIIGTLTKNIAAGATSKTFEIGDASNYMPVTIAFGNVSVAGDLTVSTTASSHASIASSGINSAKSLARYWTLSGSGITFDNFSATFTFLSGDILGSANTSAFVSEVYSGSAWSSNLTMGTLTSTTSQVTGVTSFGDFVLGEAKGSSPQIAINGSLTSFGYVATGSYSAEQSYSVSGSNLTSNITITPPAGFQITKTSGSGYVSNPSTIVLTQSGGVVNSTPIYVRFAPTSTKQYSDSVTHVTTGASASLTVNGTSNIASEPTTASSNVLYSGYSGTSLTVSWTAGNGANHLVLVKAGSAISADPVDGYSYTANTAFGNGSQIGTGNYVVYNGSGSTVTITGLSTGTFYYVRVIEFNGSGDPAQNYLTSSYGESHPIAPGSISAVASGIWASGTTWSSGSAPTASTNIVIPSGFTVSVDASGTNYCLNLTVESGATLVASGGSNVTSGNQKTIRINGPMIINDGTVGNADGTDGLRFDMYYTSGTVTLSGSGTTKLSKLLSQAIVPEVKISQNIMLTYQASASGGGSGYQFATSSSNYITLTTISAGDTLTFGTPATGGYTNFNTTSSSSTDGLANWTCNVYGVVNMNANANINLLTASGYTGTFNVKAGGVVNCGGQFKPSITSPSTIIVEGALNFGTGSSDFSTVPSQYISGSGSVTLPSGGSLLIGASAGLDPAAGPIRTTSRSFNSGASYSFNGSSAQVTGSDFPASVSGLTINNSGGVSLTSALTVNGTLTLSAGVLTLGSHNFTLNGSISGTPSSSRMIDASGTGEFRKTITSVPTAFLFPVGSGSVYSPAKIDLTSGTLSSAYIAVKVAAVKSSNNSSASNYLNRTWTISANGITNPVYNDTLTYAAGDVVGSEASLNGGLYSGASWISLGAVDAINHYIMGSGLTSFGEFTGGEFSSAGHVTVKVIPQGFYNSGVLNQRDTIKILLANAASPYAVVDSAEVVLDSLSFSATGTFSTAANGNYYIVIKHRSSVETWSASGVSYAKGTTTDYDFTSAASQAYGNNEVEVTAGVFAMYSGDCNQDGYVDPLDLSMVDQDSFNYVSGLAMATDVNGDAYVDPLDLSIVDQNSFNYVGIQRPAAVRVMSAKERAKTLPAYQKWLESKRTIK